MTEVVETASSSPAEAEAPEASAESTSTEVTMSFGGGAGEVVPPQEAAVTTLAQPEPEDDVLDLTSLIPTRKMVKLPTQAHPEGEVFELRLLDDFGLIDQQQLLTWSKRFEQLWNNETGKDLTKEEQTVMLALLDRMFQLVLAPPKGMSDEDFAKVKATFPDHIKSRVVTAFTYVPLMMRREAEAREAVEEEKRKATELPTAPSTTES